MAKSFESLKNVREDDFIEYFLFPTVSDITRIDTILNKYLCQIKEIVGKNSERYLFHKDNFKVTTRTSKNKLLEDFDNSLPPHLHGVSHYGDNIEDEWFIVFLLFQISKEIPDIIIRTVDSDGEFLLIEAANHLPVWATPEVCENRVYIYKGFLHIIGSDNLNSLSDKISIQEAIHQISQSSQQSLASINIQNSIQNKIEKYPNRIYDTLHCARVFVPIGVAHILKNKPNFIAPAVQAFCNRDVIDMKTCRAMKYFPPENRVYIHATFTKYLYAMLSHSKFIPDSRTGWNLPSINKCEYKSHLLGLKLACGFEILASQASTTESFENDKGWQHYFQSLKNKKYFEDYLEHSVNYNNLLTKAKEYYVEYKDSMHQIPIIGQEILDVTKNLNCDSNEFAQDNLPNDDDESWLNINSEDLDKMLEEQYGKKMSTTVNTNFNASQFAQKINQFLNNVSDFEGAEYPEHNLTKNENKPPENKKINKKDDKEKANNYKVDFDPDQFNCALENFLDYMIPEDNSWDLESDSDMSDYEAHDTNFANDMKNYMDEMDLELSRTNVGKSFIKQKNANIEGFDDVENFKPVDIDMNALKNVLESYQSQMGEAGPASNMLEPMGIKMQTGNNEDYK